MNQNTFAYLVTALACVAFLLAFAVYLCHRAYQEANNDNKEIEALTFELNEIQKERDAFKSALRDSVMSHAESIEALTQTTEKAPTKPAKAKKRGNR
jgi:septal ring factor EnvC (AmiA/AmiB activator)